MGETVQLDTDVVGPFGHLSETNKGIEKKTGKVKGLTCPLIVLVSLALSLLETHHPRF